ncbi:D-alanine--D-alanine ligase family protein [Sporohalobacter salinus]|uniref:D-alanine--D-alanine ligase family protein n=1 Tax=Sporohalobacter salinus TaxID=1494606 RepID=UPI00196112F9|nr:D-alanine--D-alanine ligase [Sporohalobacter salinus]MBM7624384.1 D-alanine-D-alanine ligase [Sporohalobacter salinus]
MNKKVAVIRGGRSKERDISLKTGKAVYKALKSKGVDVIALDPEEENFYQKLTDKDIDVAFIALHGRYGEDGTIQGLFEMMDIPYAGSGVLSSSLAMDKVVSKKIFKQEGILTPEFKVLNRESWKQQSQKLLSELKAEFNFPLVVKPALEGSSLGLSIIKKKENLAKAVDEAFEYDSEILIEKYIEGKEITVGILGNQDLVVLPIIEIKPKNGVYDFEAKYTKGMTEFIIPARLEEEIYNWAQEMANKAYKVLKCSGMARVDLIVSKEGKPYVLEVNTIPGMTETSLLPQAAKAAEIEFPDLVLKILEYAVE